MATPGVLHRYTDKLVAFEHASTDGTLPTPSAKPNTILFIGGLSDGLLTVDYTKAIATRLPPSWSIAEVLLSSSYEGWRFGSLKRDAEELHECVEYFRALKKEGKIVLMGHSTGCQDIMWYLVVSNGRPDGVILQGGVSDREAWIAISRNEGKSELYDVLLTKAEELSRSGKRFEPVPRDGNFMLKEDEPPISAYRTWSLLAKGAEDDFFSSDLDDETINHSFGRLAKATPAVMFLLGSLDPYVPDHVSKEALLTRWTEVIRKHGGHVDYYNGGIVPGAHHNLNGDPENVVQDLVGRVVRFVKNIESASSEEPRSS
jgi:pimeloyl-ACP methyl ester carboxylesterase